MMDFLIYDGKVAIALLVFGLFYRFLLKKETFHRFNRVVLMGLTVLSFILPLCIITIRKPMDMDTNAYVSAAGLPDASSQELMPMVETMTPWWQTALIILFWAGAAFVLVRVLGSILSIVRIIRRGEMVQDDGCRIIVTEREIDPFSWMKYIVLSRKDWEGDNTIIIAHEKAHIVFGHSVEVLLVDILSALQWFNPACWMLRADLQELHEYEADDAVLRAGTEIKEYQYLIIRKTVSKGGYSVANSFNHSILKNRITMMSKSKSPLKRRLRAFWLVPLVCLGIGLQARTVYIQVGNNGGIIDSPKGVLEEIVVVKYADASQVEIMDDEHSYQLPSVEGLVLLEDVTTQPICSERFNIWLNQRIPYPKECVHTGTVKVSFVVDENGKVGHVSLLQGVCDELDKAVMELVKKSPVWLPAMKGDRPVAVRLIQPVHFMIRITNKDNR